MSRQVKVRNAFEPLAADDEEENYEYRFPNFSDEDKRVKKVRFGKFVEVMKKNK